jgi:hypothetical protein
VKDSDPEVGGSLEIDGVEPDTGPSDNPDTRAQALEERPGKRVGRN